MEGVLQRPDWMRTDQIGSAPPGLSDKPDQEDGFVLAQQSGRDHGIGPVLNQPMPRAGVRATRSQVPVHGMEPNALAWQFRSAATKFYGAMNHVFDPTVEYDMKNLALAGLTSAFIPMWVIVLCVGLLVLTDRSSRAEPPRPGVLNCASGVSAEQRRRCDEEAFRQVQSGSQSTQLEGGWRLVKSKNPDGGADAISVMHVVDSAKSDTRLAGLNLQCGQDGIEVVFIVLEPLSRATRPNVTLIAGEKRTEFQASVIQGGLALLLPADAAKLATIDWQNANELSVEIGAPPTAIRGAVPIAGLATALGYLQRNCHAR